MLIHHRPAKKRTVVMKRGARWLAAGALLAGMDFRAAVAHALGPVAVEIAGKAGFATNPTTTGPNPMGRGLGGRVGVSMSGFYAGAAAMFYLGGTATAGSESESEHSTTIGGEVGYGVRWSCFTLRGRLGVGRFEQAGSGVATGGRDNLYMEPGVLAMCSFGPLFLGAEANAFLLPSAVTSTYAALTVDAQIGVTF